ncbi:uncharacterized protein EDB93DRAFT_1247766 [Suillus bovinus]|uniref:uncharacterized protein n=1 Tax=Suillus bovinus TaxID=48563 RepID=UPI001B874F00|nr:uncharacterized protein EDB93DRAFT_1247766 [Suillus bovinus]KAG2155285.1 hypothetical protein EDB93DRAFT_1247766 [Suillus bovinus]
MSHTIPQVRRRPTKLRPSGVRPDSSIVRASVFETALELGIHNSTVANWIFNSPLPEELEELEDIPTEIEAQETLTPALTFGSHTTSDESSTTSSPQSNVASARQIHTHKPSVFEPLHVHFNDFASAQLTLSLPPLSTSVNEKERPGSMSNLSGKPSNDVGHPSNEDITRQTDRKCATPSSARSEPGYVSDGQYLSDSAGFKKSGKLKGRGKKGKPPALDFRSGFDEAPDYSSDGGYLSASSSKSQGKSSKGKSRAMAFFRRKPKKPRASDEEDDNYIPPVPAMPPIAVPSSPRPLKHLVATPSSPTRSGFTPLKLNFNTSTRASSPVLNPRKDRASPPLARVVAPSSIPTPPRPSEQTVTSMPSPSPSPVPPSTPPLALPSMPISRPSTPSTPLSVVPPISQAPATPVRSSPIASPRNIAIRPAAPPPTQPLPQPPPSPMPSMSSQRAPGPPPMQALPPVPVRPLPMPPSTPTTPSRRLPPFRPAAVVPGPTAPLVPRRHPQAQSRILSSPRPQPSHSASDSVVPQYKHDNSEASPRRYQSHSVAPSDDRTKNHPPGHGGMVRRQHSEMPPPPFLQRRMHGVQGSPRHPPPDSPLPQIPNAHPMHPPAFPSKFHEHFSSVSSMGYTSPALRSTSGSGSSSGPSVRSIRSSNAPSVSTSDSHGRSSRHSEGVVDTHPDKRSSLHSESSYGKRNTASIAYSQSQSSVLDTRSDISASVYDERSSTHDEDGGNDPKGAHADDEDDDDASLYPSDEKTAGRRTMYLVENGQALEEDGDVFPPPLPPPVGGYF